MLIVIDYKSSKDVFNKCLNSIEQFGSVSEIIILGEHSSYKHFRTYNQAINYFLTDTIEEYIVFVKDYITFHKTLTKEAPLSLYDCFIKSYQSNKFPVQSTFISQGISCFGENEFIYHCTKPQDSCVIANRDIVKKTGYLDETNCLGVWQARANTLAGRYPEDFIVLKHSYRYVSLQRDCIIPKLIDLDKERLDEIYKGKELKLWRKYA